MKPSEQINDIRNKMLESVTVGGEAMAISLAIIKYLDEQWEKGRQDEERKKLRHV